MQVSFCLFSTRIQDFAANFSMGAVLKILITRQRASLSLVPFFLFPHLTYTALSLWLCGSHNDENWLFRGTAEVRGRRYKTNSHTPGLFSAAAFAFLYCCSSSCCRCRCGTLFLRQNEVFTTYMPACYLSGFVAASSCMQVQLRRGRFLLMMIVITKPVE
jgi:hypothetical protein